ncbi:MAG: fumarylacetoacetase [Planctomycetes bacterium]|nr:fumarylacetoacetase [Planctomycetota bacterium]
MEFALDHATLRSFVPVAPDGHFPIQNLPYGVFQRQADDVPRIGVAIGDLILDLSVLAERGLLADAALARALGPGQTTLNAFMALGVESWRKARARLTQLLRADERTLRDDRSLRDKALVTRAAVRMLLPACIENYTDFYSSREHATNVGVMLRGADNALMPNWLHLPVAYHGRASSIVPSGVDIVRPCGQARPDDAAPPVFGPSRFLDFELEMGFFIGPGNELGRPIPIGRAAEHVFGMVLVNDWSARDIQKWEYQPLGPFLAKNFATSISCWVVPLEALAPFRVAGPKQEPAPFPYLRSPGDWSYDIHLEVRLQAASQAEPQTICRTNARHLYWNVCQQVAHHSVGGCNLRTGDLLATGTISGPDPGSYGSMLELAWKGTKPLRLGNGESRVNLHDGDRVTLTGWCQGDGYRVGFGETTAQVLPAVEPVET